MIIIIQRNVSLDKNQQRKRHICSAAKFNNRHLATRTFDSYNFTFIIRSRIKRFMFIRLFEMKSCANVKNKTGAAYRRTQLRTVYRPVSVYRNYSGSFPPTSVMRPSVAGVTAPCSLCAYSMTTVLMSIDVLYVSIEDLSTV